VGFPRERNASSKSVEFQEKKERVRRRRNETMLSPYSSAADINCELRRQCLLEGFAFGSSPTFDSREAIYDLICIRMVISRVVVVSAGLCCCHLASAIHLETPPTYT
jgi:hypothetical protein